MEKAKKFGVLLVILVCASCMFVFVYTLIKLSLQEGESSSRFTQAVVQQVGEAAFDQELDESQIQALNLFLRAMAHFVLFSILSFGLCTVAFLVFAHPAGRVFGLVLNMLICVALAYGTEYFKQFVDGRHFQIEDAWLNMYGVIIGLCSFLMTDLIFWAIRARSASHSE